MKKALYILGAATFLLAACTNETNDSKIEASLTHDHSAMYMNEQKSLQQNVGENALTYPPLLKPASQSENEITYTLTAQKGSRTFIDDIQTNTYGYNGDFLGPTLQFKKGQTVHIQLKNELDEATTFHWHGLEVAGDATDGSPHEAIQPGESKTITFTVKQAAASLWYHPHPMGKTAEQVYKGLAGMMYIEDAISEASKLPKNYGKNDFPLILQDRTFVNGQIDYEKVANTMSTLGDTIMVNGVVNPYMSVTKEKVRLRILNGSNALTYNLKLTDNTPFELIATDGGFLEKAQSLTALQLAPGERAEIVVDFSAIKADRVTLFNNDTAILPINVTEQALVNPATATQVQAPLQITEALKKQAPSKTITMEGATENFLLNGQTFDMARIDFKQKQGVTEIWEIENIINDEGVMAHPFHIHGTQFQVISVNGKEPHQTMQGMKDTILVQANQKIKIAVSFPEKGLYMFHCHILEHEDAGMMGQIEVY